MMPQNELLVGNTVRILDSEQILSVSEVSNLVKSTIEKNFIGIRIQGEISGVKIHSSGHIYFSLKDQTSVINAISWRGTKLTFPLEDGIEVVAHGRVTVYPARSQYQFIVESASIAGEGALLKLLNDRRKKFQELGYFSRKRQLPKYPNVIGIVTSKTGSVLQDMLHRLRDRYQFCTIIVWPVNVQGTAASEQIANAIRGFNFLSTKRPDLLIIARGGGSIEDLWPFNEEVVIGAVFESGIPIISAIGHETDTTLIDYASDLRAPTPTAAIELCTPVLAEMKFQISENNDKMRNAMVRFWRENANRVNLCTKTLSACKFVVVSLCQRFDDITDQLSKSILFFLNCALLRLQNQRIKSLQDYFALKDQRYRSAMIIFDRIVQHRLKAVDEMLASLSGRLEQSSYKTILKKGFCFITNSSGTAIVTKSSFEREQTNNLFVTFVDGVSEVYKSK
jgi:exodeoxyribonuclease VII large subunit